MALYSANERGLRERQSRQHDRHSINVQQRVAARRKIRQTRTLEKSFVFAGIGGAATDAILAVMDFQRYKKGDMICHQGAEADRFYVIVSGKCKVEQRVPQMRRDEEENVSEMVHVGDLRALDVMGENALVSCGGPEEVAHFRSATVTVVSVHQAVLRLLLESRHLWVRQLLYTPPRISPYLNKPTILLVIRTTRVRTELTPLVVTC